MPITCTIDHDRKLVTATAAGEVGLKDMEDYLDGLVTGEAMPYPKLFDATTAVPRLSDDDMMMLGARVSAYRAFDPRGPLAIVVGSTASHELAARFANLGGAARAAGIFWTIDDARRWLDNQMKLATQRR